MRSKGPIRRERDTIPFIGIREELTLRMENGHELVVHLWVANYCSLWKINRLPNHGILIYTEP